jgi:hypothetical protein
LGTRVPLPSWALPCGRVRELSELAPVIEGAPVHLTGDRGGGKMRLALRLAWSVEAPSPGTAMVLRRPQAAIGP